MRPLVAAALLLLLPAEASAATFVVNKEADDNGPCTPGDCALREAILAANAAPGADVVEVPAGVYQLSIPGPFENLGMTGDLNVRFELTLRGESADDVIVIGDGSDRVLRVNTLGGTSEVSGMTLTGGVGDGVGSGLRVEGPSFILLRDLEIRDNVATFGFGGGLFVAATRQIVIENITLADNSSPQGSGGGAYISANSVSDFVDLVNVSVSGNSALRGGGLNLFGGGFFSLVNVTVANNTSPLVAGILGDTTVRLSYANVLVVNNDCGYIAAIPTSNGFNMESPGITCFPASEGGVPDVLLGPLVDNGGQTRTHALLAGSPAIDAALDSDCPPTDQRGVPRPTDGDFNGTAGCDVGAFEAAGANPFEIPTLGPRGLALLALLLAFFAVTLQRRHP